MKQLCFEFIESYSNRTKVKTFCEKGGFRKKVQTFKKRVKGLLHLTHCSQGDDDAAAFDAVNGVDNH